MSRSGYSDDLDNWAMIRWRGRVASATRGKRGQTLLRELLTALDAMPEKRLIAHELQADGQYCALGVVGSVRGVDLAKLDPEDPDAVGAAFDIAPCLAQEIVYENDEGGWGYQEAPGVRWGRVRAWVASQLLPCSPASGSQESGSTE